MKCFELLGLKEDASALLVKQTYRQLAMKKHPDRGGDPAEFDQIRKAYDEALVIAEAPKTCTKCNGTGKTNYGSGLNNIKMICPLCGGTGVFDGLSG